MTQELAPLLEALRGVQSDESPTALATVVSHTSAGVEVTFDGEGAPSARRYMQLQPVHPVAGQRVVMLRVGSTWVVAARVLTDSQWDTWTPTIGGVTTSSFVARYKGEGQNTVRCRVRLAMSAAPSTSITISLPFTAVSAWAGTTVDAAGTALGKRGASWREGTVYLNTTTTVAVLYNGSTGAVWGSGDGVGWASGDLMGWEWVFERA